MDLDKKIIKYILTPLEYGKIDHISPCIFKHKKDSQEILLYGCEHSNNPNKAHFSKIGNLFDKFLKKHNKRNIIVVLEDITPKKIDTLDNLIKKHRETGYVYKFAYENGIKHINIEPKAEEIMDFVLKRNRRQIDIVAWIFCNALVNMLQESRTLKDNQTKELELIINNIAKIVEIKKDVYKKVSNRINSLTNKSILPSKIDLLTHNKFDFNLIKKIEDPFIEKTPINLVGSDFNLARDYFMSKLIIKKFNEGYSIFGVLGINHVISQKEVYKNLLIE